MFTSKAIDYTGKSSCQRRIFSWYQEKEKFCLIGNARRFDREITIGTNSTVAVSVSVAWG